MIDRYALPEMKHIWSDQSRYERWLEVELQVLEQQEIDGVVPKSTLKKLRSLTVNAEEILEIEETVKHDVIAFLTHLENQNPEAKWLHFGMTSSDVLDTTFSGQLRDAGWIIDGKIVNYLIALKKRAFENKDIPTVGRTHGIHAEPTTLGLVFAGFYAEMVRNMKRLHKAIESISVGKISGAVGNYGMFLTEYSEAVSLRRLYLRAEDCATQVVARDRYAEFFSILALIAAGVERFALQVRHWQRTEVGEVYEGFTKGQKGSSAMPHKKNPILSENLCGLSRLVRGYANTAMENIALWHERDISHSSVERVIGPDATILVDFMLHRATGLVNNLVIDYSRVDANLNMTKGLIFSSALLLKMVQKGVPRQEAYELVQSHALYAAKQKMDFFQKCINSKEMLRVLSSSEIGDCFNLQNNYKNVCNIFDRVFGYFDE